MSNPTTKIECKPVNTFEALLEEFRRQYDILREKRVEAKKLHLKNPYDIDYFALQGMAIDILLEQGFSENQAVLIEAKCFEDNHACFEDYLCRLPGYAKFAKELISAAK